MHLDCSSISNSLLVLYSVGGHPEEVSPWDFSYWGRNKARDILLHSCGPAGLVSHDRFASDAV